jgi:hypothetical protein
MAAVVETDAEDLARCERCEEFGDVSFLPGLLQAGVKVAGAAEGGAVGFLRAEVDGSRGVLVSDDVHGGVDQ